MPKLIKGQKYNLEFRIINDLYNPKTEVTYTGKLRNGLHWFTESDGSEFGGRDLTKDFRNITPV